MRGEEEREWRGRGGGREGGKVTGCFVLKHEVRGRMIWCGVAKIR